MTSPARQLAEAAWQRLQAGLDQGGAIAEEIRSIGALLRQAEEVEPPRPQDHPVTRHLPAALKGVTGLDALAGPLSWRYSYAPSPARAGLEDRLAWTEIVGERAPLRHGALNLGYLLLAPETIYPPHAHPAVELYHVVSGTALWTAGDILRRRVPGDFILHPSGVPHATRTRAQPLLAIYTWTGEVGTASRFVE